MVAGHWQKIRTGNDWWSYNDYQTCRRICPSRFLYLLDLIANLSIMLALINILPVPALDGGHITIVVLEEIRRKPLSTRTKVKIQQVGMAILLVLIVFVMYNDILRILKMMNGFDLTVFIRPRWNGMKRFHPG